MSNLSIRYVNDTASVIVIYIIRSRHTENISTYCIYENWRGEKNFFQCFFIFLQFKIVFSYNLSFFLKKTCFVSFLKIDAYFKIDHHRILRYPFLKRKISSMKWIYKVCTLSTWSTLRWVWNIEIRTFKY